MPHHDHNDAPHGWHPPHHHHQRASAADQLSDEEIMRFAPPEIRRLARRISDLESRLREMQDNQSEILALLKSLKGA